MCRSSLQHLEAVISLKEKSRKEPGQRKRCWKRSVEQQYGFESQRKLRELELIQEACKNDKIQLKRESGS